MTEQDMYNFEDERADDADSPVDPVKASTDEHESIPSPSEPTEVTKEYKDPTLGMMAAEYALYGHTYDGRHVFGEE